MQTNTNWKFKEDLKSNIEVLRKLQIDYNNAMFFLKDISNLLSRSWEKDNGYSIEGLKETAALIDRQIDGYSFDSVSVSNVNFNISEIHEKLNEFLEKQETKKI